MHARVSAGDESANAGDSDSFVEARQIDIEQEIERQIALSESWAWEEAIIRAADHFYGFEALED